MGFRILLAEDNITDQFVVQKMLEQLGCKVETVENGFLAVDAVRHRPYDLVLMDRNMPLLDGYEATRLIREFRRQNELPIIAITASQQPDDEQQCLAAGMNGFLAKPVAQYKFREVLCRWVWGYREKYVLCDIGAGSPTPGTKPDCDQVPV